MYCADRGARSQREMLVGPKSSIGTLARCRGRSLRIVPEQDSTRFQPPVLLPFSATEEVIGEMSGEMSDESWSSSPGRWNPYRPASAKRGTGNLWASLGKSDKKCRRECRGNRYL